MAGNGDGTRDRGLMGTEMKLEMRMETARGLGARWKFKARFGLVAYDVLQCTGSPAHGTNPTIAAVCLPGSELR